VVENFKQSFPELVGKMAWVQEVILDEEDSFARTISRGMKYFKKVTSAMRAKNISLVDAGDMVFLSDSLGFPADLTQRMAEELDPPMSVDMEGYQKKMEELREMARMGGKKAANTMVLESEQTVALEKLNIKPTEDLLKYEVPVDGTPYFKEGLTVKAIYDGKAFPTKLSKGAAIGVVLDQTPFYAESGGQSGDVGMLTGPNNSFSIRVENVQKFGAYVLHVGTIVAGDVKANTKVTAKVDTALRQMIAPNHTGTHVLNMGLRHVIGGDCDQKGSLVTGDKLRFDFNAKPIAAKDIAAIEAIVNKQINDGLEVFSKVIPLADARRINTLRAVFGEEYPDPVRVISVGNPVDTLTSDPTNSKWGDFSVELCGGTHVSNMAQLESFVIIEEAGVSKGVRRITGVTRDMARQAEELAAKLKKRVDQAKECKGHKLIDEEKELRQVLDTAQISVAKKALLNADMKLVTKSVIKFKKELQAQAVKLAVEEGSKVAEKAKAANAPFTVCQINFGADGMAARKLMDAASKIHPTGAFLVVSAPPKGTAGKAGAFAKVPKDMVAKLNAKDWAATTLKCVGGKGGGKPEQAQAVANITAQQSAAPCLEAATSFAKAAL